MPVIRLGAPDGQNKLISVGFDHLEISTDLSKLCWLFCFQTIVCSTISRFWYGFRTTYYNNHCSIDNGKRGLEHGNAAKLGVLNFYERIKELHTKCCTARRNWPGLFPKTLCLFRLNSSSKLVNLRLLRPTFGDQNVIERWGFDFFKSFIKLPTKCCVAVKIGPADPQNLMLFPFELKLIFFETRTFT